ncbi:MAG: class I SAM-dependent methyltransferase, partial [Candidatus Eisenbacteria bacterium]
LFHAYVEHVLRRIGAGMSGQKAAYAYLSKTIRGFYGAQELAVLIQEAGFTNVKATTLFLGVAAIHEAKKTR